MGQEFLVEEYRRAGERLIDALSGAGVEVSVAFWAKPEGESEWYLYVASPLADHAGPVPVFRAVDRAIRADAELNWLAPLQVRVIGAEDSTAAAAVRAMTPVVPSHPFATQNPAPYPPTWYQRASLGGLDLGQPAYIYPLPVATA